MHDAKQTLEKNVHALSGIRTHYPKIKRLQTYALDRKVKGIGPSRLKLTENKYSKLLV